MLKDFTLSLELEPTENRVVQTAAIFWSHDVNTANIYIELLRKGTPIILNKDVTVRVMMLFDDENKSEHIYTAKIEDELKGLVSITLEESMRMYVGQVTAGVYLEYGNEEKTDNGYFTFGMRRSLIDKDMPDLKKLYVSDFEDALKGIEEFKGDIKKEIEEIDINITKNQNEIEKLIGDNNAKIKELESQIATNQVLTTKDKNEILMGADIDEVPYNGYKKGTKWYFREGTTFPGMNMLKGTVIDEKATRWEGHNFNYIKGTKHPFYNEGNALECMVNKTSEATFWYDKRNRIKKTADKLYFSMSGFFGENITSTDVYLMGRKEGETVDHSIAQKIISGEKLPSDKLGSTSVIIDTYNYDEFYIRYDNNGSTEDGANASLFLCEMMLTDVPHSKYSPNPEDILGETRVLVAKKDNDQFDFSDWEPFEKVNHKNVEMLYTKIEHNYSRIKNNSNKIHDLSTSNNGTVYVAHRGANYDAPENSIPAFEYVTRHQAIETDIQTTKDGVWVCMHDDTVDRMTDGSGKVSELTFEEIQSLRINNFRTTDPNAGLNMFSDNELKVPTFEEYLRICKRRNKKPVCEIKNFKYHKNEYESLFNLVDKYNMKQNMSFICFDKEILMYVRDKYPEMNLHLLAPEINDKYINDALEIGGYVTLSVSHVSPSINEQNVKLLRDKGIGFAVWTPDNFDKFEKLGADFITTDSKSGNKRYYAFKNNDFFKWL